MDQLTAERNDLLAALVLAQHALRKAGQREAARAAAEVIAQMQS